MATASFAERIPGLTVVVASGGTSTITNVRAPATVFVNPGSGGTMTCKCRVTPGGTLVDIDPDTASYSADAMFTLNSPVYEIVFGATTQAGEGAVAVPA